MRLRLRVLHVLRVRWLHRPLPLQGLLLVLMLLVLVLLMLPGQ